MKPGDESSAAPPASETAIWFCCPLYRDWEHNYKGINHYFRFIVKNMNAIICFEKNSVNAEPHEGHLKPDFFSIKLSFSETEDTLNGQLM